MAIKKFLSDKHVLFYFLVLLVVLTRLLPHPMNFTPIGALGLFAGAYVKDQRAWLIPLAALFLSDLLIGFYTPIVMISVYVSFALSAVIGKLILFDKRSVIRIGGSAITSASILFVLSNFALWTTGLYYPLTMDGLAACFIMAIPFYGNTLAGDLFYSALLFGVYESVRHWLDRGANPHIA